MQLEECIFFLSIEHFEFLTISSINFEHYRIGLDQFVYTSILVAAFAELTVADENSLVLNFNHFFSHLHLPRLRLTNLDYLAIGSRLQLSSVLSRQLLLLGIHDRVLVNVGNLTLPSLIHLSLFVF